MKEIWAENRVLVKVVVTIIVEDFLSKDGTICNLLKRKSRDGR